MSVAFTREEDLEAAAAHVPDRPVSPHRNLVTPEGLAAIEAALAAAREAYAAAQTGGDVKADRSAMAIATRDLRYWTARRQSAELAVVDAPADVVAFGRRVSVERDDGRRLVYRIVGEDEADPAKGSVSHVSPLAVALLGRKVGDTAVFGSHEVEILAVDGS